VNTYDAWLADFRLRLAQHDAGVEALADDLTSRTTWTVRANAAAGAGEPSPDADRPPDVLCERGWARPPIWFEVELPETLVRRATVERLRALSRAVVEPRVVLVVPSEEHERLIAGASRMLGRAGLPLAVAAIAPDERTITGADW
jgi:hypothetical protein